MEYTMRAIETEYRGNIFRSRLEARWAAFFDLAGWQWNYEPLDLPGWSPDFALQGGRILVEVKPITEFDQATADKMATATSDSTADLLLLGVGPFVLTENRWDPAAAVGWANDPVERDDEEDWDDVPAWSGCWDSAFLARWEESQGIGYAHELGSWRDRISQWHDGNRYTCVRPGEVSRLWAEAGRAVRFRYGIRRST